MSGRVQKSKSPGVSKSPGASTRRRLLRILRFANEGIVNEMPCSNCRSRGVRCLLLPDSDTCGTCHRLGIPCDASEDAICALNRLVAESDRLDKAEEAEEAKFRERAAVLQQKAEAYQKAQSELNESLAKLEQLREQKRMVFKKGKVAVAESSEEVSDSVLEAQSVDALFDWNPVTPNFLSGES
ncbi:hypothetical protein K456DRAFT_1419257 [Colletotrichum gloeosporioides 23]|nr:hypothetical protein K456DRAFT_1419257 [Colletotrichum gloeosporioides 23]